MSSFLFGCKFMLVNLLIYSKINYFNLPVVLDKIRQA